MDDELYNFLDTLAHGQSHSLADLAKLTNASILDLYVDAKYLLGKNYLQYLPDPATGKVTDKDAYAPKEQLAITTEGRIVLNNYKKHERRNKLLEARNWISFIVAILSFFMHFFN